MVGVFSYVDSGDSLFQRLNVQLCQAIVAIKIENFEVDVDAAFWVQVYTVTSAFLTINVLSQNQNHRISAL